MYCGLNFLRGIAAFFIVGCHLQLYPRTASGMAVIEFCDVNVGLFGAISGFLFANRALASNFDVSKYVRRRIARLVPIYIAWTLFYLVASFVFSLVIKRYIPIEKYHSLGFWYGVLFWGDSSTHLCFIASLLYIQILLSVCTEFLKSIHLKPLTIFVFSIGVVYFSTLSGDFYFMYPLRLLGFVVLGVSIRMLDGEKRRIPWKLAILLIVLAMGVHSLHNIGHAFLRDFLLVSVVMIAFTQSSLASLNVKCMSIISECSLGVFLVHPFFAGGIAEVFRRCSEAPYGGIIVVVDWILIYLISLAVTLIGLRIPYVKQVLK